MRFMAIYKTQERNAPPTQQEMAEMGRFTDEQAKVALEIFGCVGRCLEAEDKKMDAVTSLNGSGPAFARTRLATARA